MQHHWSKLTADVAQRVGGRFRRCRNDLAANPGRPLKRLVGRAGRPSVASCDGAWPASKQTLFVSRPVSVAVADVNVASRPLHVTSLGTCSGRGLKSSNAD